MLERTDPQMYGNKMRMASSADAIVSNAENVNREAPAHERADDIVAFNRGNIRVIVGGGNYTGDVLTAIYSNGQEAFFDINNLARTNRDEAPSERYAANNGSFSQADDAPTDNILKPAGTVKTDSAEGSVGAAVDRGARGRYNPSAGPEALAMKELARVMERAGDSPASIARATGLQPDGQGGFVPASTPQTEAGKPGAEHVVQRMLAAGLPEAQQQNAERKAQEQRLEEAATSENADALPIEVPIARAAGVRPTWKQSEADAWESYPDYIAQVSFAGGEQVAYGARGSVRPDYYKTGYSVEVKNYGLHTQKGRNSLVYRVVKQFHQRLENLPTGTQQIVLIDIRGQELFAEDLLALYAKIIQQTNNGIIVRFEKDKEV